MCIVVAYLPSLLRHAVAGLLRDRFDDRDVREASTPEQAIEIVAQHENALLLIDIDAIEGEPRHELRRLRHACPGSLLAVLANQPDSATILECLGAGCRGYILKTEPTDRFIIAIDHILRGELWVPAGGSSARLAARRTDVAARPAPLPVRQLTPRQRDVLTLIGEGRSTKEIARELNLGIGTIKVHLDALYRSLGVHNRAAAVARGQELAAPLPARDIQPQPPANVVRFGGAAQARKDLARDLSLVQAATTAAG